MVGFSPAKGGETGTLLAGSRFGIHKIRVAPWENSIVIVIPYNILLPHDQLSTPCLGPREEGRRLFFGLR